MNEETGITVVGAIGIVAVVALALLLIRHLASQQNRGPQAGSIQEQNSPE
ncbi:MAG TPA: hypothetical protein VGR72_14295 [Candidatus Acidoferrales bacterium]|nr:hypothetical protein [Candidatus Acidoferrales bacterium]